jgi:hypothetical protein
MAILPTPDDNARMVLQIYQSFKARSGHALVESAFVRAAVKRGLVLADIQDGLIEAQRRGWIERGQNNSFVLTDLGFAEM